MCYWEGVGARVWMDDGVRLFDGTQKRRKKEANGRE